MINKIKKSDVLAILNVSKSYFDKSIQNKYVFPSGKDGNCILYDSFLVEEFKKNIQDIGEGFENIINFSDYKINKVGDIYSCIYLIPILLKPKEDKDGYFSVMLINNGKRYYRRVNRLVAENFIENPNNFPIVNHKDENKKNNDVNNLEWCTVQYNTTYSSHVWTGDKNYKSIGVYAYKNNGEFIDYFESGRLCAKYFNMDENSIRMSCNNLTKHGRSGYYFRRSKI